MALIAANEGNLPGVAAEPTDLPAQLALVPSNNRGFDRMLQHHQSAGVLLLGDEETRTQRAHFTFGGAHAQRTAGIGRHLNHQFAVAQDHQPLLVIEVQIHRAVGV